MSGAFGRGDEDVGGDGLVEELEERVAPEIQDPLQDPRVELAAEDGGGAQQVVARRRERVEASADDVAHALRQGQRDARRGLRGEAALVGQEPRDLAHEEGVALGHVEDGAGPGVARRRAGDVGDEVGDGLGGEAAERHALAAGLAGELGEERAEGVATAHLDVAVRRHEEDARRAELGGEEARHAERVRIGVVEVVERHEERAPARGAAQEAGRGVEEAEAGLLALEARGHREGGKARAQLGDELGQRRAVALEVREKLAAGGAPPRRGAPPPTASRAARPRPRSSGRRASARRGARRGRPPPRACASSRCRARRRGARGGRALRALRRARRAGARAPARGRRGAGAPPCGRARRRGSRSRRRAPRLRPRSDSPFRGRSG